MKDKYFELQGLEHEKKANEGEGKRETPVSFGQKCYMYLEGREDLEKAIFEIWTDQSYWNGPLISGLPNRKPLTP